MAQVGDLAGFLVLPHPAGLLLSPGTGWLAGWLAAFQWKHLDSPGTRSPFRDVVVNEYQLVLFYVCSQAFFLQIT